MATLATINIKAVLDSKGVQNGAQQASKSIKTLGDSGGSSLMGLASKMGGFLAASFGIYKAIGVFNQARNAIDDMAKSADRLGIAVETMQGFSLAGNLAGNNAQEISMAFGRMSGVLDDAIQKGGESKLAFDRLGLSLNDLARMSPDEQFFAVGEAINKVGNRTERTALAMDIFGKSGAKFLSFFHNGREAVSAATEQLDKWGVLLTKGDTMNVEAMNDSWTTLTTLVFGIAEKFVSVIAPSASALLGFVTDLLQPTQGINQIWEAIGMWVELAGAFAANLFSVMIGGWRIVTSMQNLFWTAMQIGMNEAIRLWDGFWGNSTVEVEREINRLMNLVGYYQDVAARGAQDVANGFTGAAGQDFVDRLNKLKDAAHIAGQDVGSGMSMAATAAAETIKVAFKDISPGALERGSSAAASAIMKAQRDAQGNATERAMLKQLEAIAKNTGGPKLAPANI